MRIANSDKWSVRIRAKGIGQQGLVKVLTKDMAQALLQGFPVKCAVARSACMQMWPVQA